MSNERRKSVGTKPKSHMHGRDEATSQAGRVTPCHGTAGRRKNTIPFERVIGDPFAKLGGSRRTAPEKVFGTCWISFGIKVSSNNCLFGAGTPKIWRARNSITQLSKHVKTQRTNRVVFVHSSGGKAFKDSTWFSCRQLSASKEHVDVQRPQICSNMCQLLNDRM